MKHLTIHAYRNSYSTNKSIQYKSDSIQCMRPCGQQSTCLAINFQLFKVTSVGFIFEKWIPCYIFKYRGFLP